MVRASSSSAVVVAALLLVAPSLALVAAPGRRCVLPRQVRRFAAEEPKVEAVEVTDEAAAAPAKKKNKAVVELDENPDQPDIIKKFVKQRDDWWDGPLTSTSEKTSNAGPIVALLEVAPLPSYAFLLTATVLSIAFVGCIFQLFYIEPDLGRAPVIGVPATVAILATSGPAFVFSFLVAIARGQQEADEDDAKYGK